MAKTAYGIGSQCSEKRLLAPCRKIFARSGSRARKRGRAPAFSAMGVGMPITAACASQRSEREGHAHFEKSRIRLRSTVDCRHSQGKEESFAWRYSGSFML